MQLARNQAILFKNTSKRKGSSQPDWIGTIDIDGEVRKFAMWFRKAKSNGQFYLLGSNEILDGKEIVKPQKSKFIPDNPYDEDFGGKPPF